MISQRRIKRFLALAVREAVKSTMKFRHGAVLVKGGKIVGSGFNQHRTCLNGIFVTSVHAEINALKDKTLNATAGTDLYIARVSEEGLGDSKPCPQCLEALKSFGVRRVFYTLRNGETAAEKVRDMSPYPKPANTIRDFRKLRGGSALLSPLPP